MIWGRQQSSVNITSRRDSGTRTKDDLVLSGEKEGRHQKRKPEKKEEMYVKVDSWKKEGTPVEKRLSEQERISGLEKRTFITIKRKVFDAPWEKKTNKESQLAGKAFSREGQRGKPPLEVTQPLVRKAGGKDRGPGVAKEKGSFRGGDPMKQTDDVLSQKGSTGKGIASKKGTIPSGGQPSGGADK